MEKYKILDGNQAMHGGTYKYTLPVKSPDGSWTPGEWTEDVIDVIACKRSYHVVGADHLIDWLGPDIYECETRGEMEYEDKFVCQSIRLTRKLENWDTKTARLYACWCVRQVWHLLADERSRSAVEVAERYAKGIATEEELSVARDAALAVAEASARGAAWAVAEAADAAARGAALAVAEAAARGAAWAVAEAAWAVAWATSEAAARATSEAAAWAVAEAAARDAARDAAWDAAWAAARAVQNEQLKMVLGLSPHPAD